MPNVLKYINKKKFSYNTYSFPALLTYLQIDLIAMIHSPNFHHSHLSQKPKKN